MRRTRCCASSARRRWPATCSAPGGTADATPELRRLGDGETHLVDHDEQEVRTPVRAPWAPARTPAPLRSWSSERGRGAQAPARSHSYTGCAGGTGLEEAAARDARPLLELRRSRISVGGRSLLSWFVSFDMTRPPGWHGEPWRDSQLGFASIWRRCEAPGPRSRSSHGNVHEMCAACWVAVHGSGPVAAAEEPRIPHRPPRPRSSPASARPVRDLAGIREPRGASWIGIP